MKRAIVLAATLLGCSSFSSASDTGKTGNTDGGSSADGGAEDGGAARDGGASTCAGGQHLLCEDFDHEKVGSAFSLTGGSGTADIVTDASSSPPASLRMTIGGGYPYPSLSAALTGSPHSVRCSFDAHLEAGDASRYLVILELGTASDSDYVQLAANADGSVFFKQYSATPSVASSDDVSGTLTMGDWTPVSFEVRAGSPPSLTVTVHGQTSHADLKVPDFASGYTRATLEAAPSQAGFDLWKIALDNFVCDAL